MCGIFGIYSENYTQDNVDTLFNCLKLLQHRGKDGHGIAYLTVKKSFLCMKKKGLLENTILRPTASYSGIGHLRYSTSGYSTQTGRIKLNECQPLRGMGLNEDDY